MSEAIYIHGTDPAEQQRLAKLGDLTNRAFLQFLEFDRHSKIVDVGSGLGILTRELALRMPDGEVWGVEKSTEQLAQAVCDLPNLHFRQADAHALPLPDDHFDVVFCRYLLEHVTDPAGVLREMRRILKPGGKIFVQENNILINAFDPDTPRFDALWQKFAHLQTVLGGDAAIGKRLYGLLRGAGFHEIALSIQPEVHHYGQPTFRPWIENLIANVRPAQQNLIAFGLATAEEIAAGLDELKGLLDNPLASTFWYWNRASGVK
ncbi:MAG TPA: methyltransferase domain-containing protein [Gemmataceae bacterium]|nr:methyltransferase domain-containing protein [Gemmataceae bacterium]